VETIHQAVYAGVLGIEASECLRTRRPRRRPRRKRHVNRRPALPNIGNRPEEVNDRSQPGHWEADQIIGANNRHAGGVASILNGQRSRSLGYQSPAAVCHALTVQ
jgi:IS30 family transposase